MIRRTSKRNASKKGGGSVSHNELDGIAQILEESMGHLSTNFDKDKVRKSYSLPTNSFGEIEFTGLNQSAKFVKLPNNAQESTLQTVLQTKWALSPPTLVISIFGGDFEKKRKLKMIFKKGLWKAAESAGCWIVTEGFNVGIMKLAGEAVRDYTDAYGGNKMIAVGVAPWAHVAKNDVLESAVTMGNPAIYQAEEETKGDDETGEVIKITGKEKSLDPNHSYFFLFDHNYTPLPQTSQSDSQSPSPLNWNKPENRDVEFRTQFEHAISSWKNQSAQPDETQNELRVPICGLVVGGNLAVLRQIFHSIVENKCPIVVCQGTSGAADAIALGLDTAQKFAIEEAALEESDLVPLEIRLESVLRECLHKTNPDEEDYKSDASILKDIVTDLSYLISVFDMEEDWDLDGYIISSLLSSDRVLKKAGTELGPNQLNLEQLEITLTLNRADIAKEKIFLENKKWKKGDLNDYMFNALMSDRHDFVKLFLEQGFSLEEFLTLFTLEKLYSDQLKNMNSRVAIFYQLWDHHKTHRKTQGKKAKNKNTEQIKIVKLREVGKVVKVLVGDFYHPLYLSKEFQTLCLKNLQASAGHGRMNSTSMRKQKKLSTEKNSQSNLTKVSYENKACIESADHPSRDISTSENGSLDKSSMKMGKLRLNARKLKNLAKTNGPSNKLHRRTSSLDMIERLSNYNSNSCLVTSNKSSINTDNKTSSLHRRTSSLDFENESIFKSHISNHKKSSSSTVSKSSSSNNSKKALLTNKDEKANNQFIIDDLDDTNLKEISLDRPARELMIWSLLVGKLQMAELFWTMEKEPIAGALLASMLLSSLAAKSVDFSDQEDYKSYSRHFETQAEGVLNECYVEDEKRAQMLINRELQFYGRSSVILLAAEGESIKFMAHPCCQDFLTNTWYGDLSSKNSITRVLSSCGVGMIIPFLLPKIIMYKADESLETGQAKSSEQTLKSIDHADMENGNLLEASHSTEDFLLNRTTLFSIKFAKHFRNKTKIYMSRVKAFYFAPIIRFFYNTVSYITFLLLFSTIILFKFKVVYTLEEIILAFWIGTLLLEEIKQIFSATLSGISFSTYFSDGWNKLDSAAISCFVIGFILRTITYVTSTEEQLATENLQNHLLLTDSKFIAAQVFLAASLFFFYVRIMYIFSFHIALGPKLIMIRKMISNDLIPFMIILMVFTIGYGVTSRSIAYPLGLKFTEEILSNTSREILKTPDNENILDMFISSYFQMFGDFGLDGITGEKVRCDSEPKYVPTPISRTINPLFLGLYVLLTNILLFNLLIAMFSRTYEEIEGSSVYYWNYQRYQMISEFVDRSPLVAPFIIIWHIYEFYGFVTKKIRFDSEDQIADFDPFCISLSENAKKERELVKWEHMKAMDYLRNLNEPTQKSRQTRGADGKSLVFRGGGGGAGGAGVGLPQQVSDGVGGGGGDNGAAFTEELGHQLDKRFKDVDSKISKLVDLETSVNDITGLVRELGNSVASLKETQTQIVEKIENSPKCQCAEVIQFQKDSKNEEEVEQVTRLEMAIRSAMTTMKAELEPMFERLLANRMEPVIVVPVEEPEQELIFTTTDDIGDINKDPFYAPDVENNTTGRIIERVVNNHRIWRYLPFNFEDYPGMRMKVPNNIVSWQVPYSDYNAYDASEEVLLYPNEHCHDVEDPSKYKEWYNNYDTNCKVKRHSMLGQYAIDPDTGAPLNPTGRTGLKNRGLLPHWGPNHSITVLFTRWSRSEKGSPVHKSNKRLLQYICLERTKRFSIPWFLLDHTPTCDLNECAIKTTLAYLEQRLQALFSSRKAEFLKKRILDSTCSQTFKGFLDDHLNSDNAWVETVVINFHESEKAQFTDDLLRIFGEENSPENIKWLDLTHSVNLRTSHDIILRTLAQKMNAHF